MIMNDLYLKVPFDVDEFACLSAGKILSTYEPMLEESLWSDWERERKFAFKLVFISICHDINWDFLQNMLAQRFTEDPNQLSADFLSKINAPTFKKWLSNYDKPERIRATERAALLRDLGQQLIMRFAGDPANIVAEANGFLFGKGGFYDLLDNFKAYREDPLRKKSNVLTHDLAKEQILSFQDTDKIMRLYVRTGRVVARTESLNKALRLGRPLTQWYIKTLRQMVSKALIQTAGIARKTIPDVNYVEWQIARNYCIAREPLCIKGIKPKNLPLDIEQLCNGLCPYINSCVAYTNPQLLKLKEPSQRRSKSFY